MEVDVHFRMVPPVGRRLVYSHGIGKGCQEEVVVPYSQFAYETGGGNREPGRFPAPPGFSRVRRRFPIPVLRGEGPVEGRRSRCRKRRSQYNPGFSRRRPWCSPGKDSSRDRTSEAYRPTPFQSGRPRAAVSGGVIPLPILPPVDCIVCGGCLSGS